MIHIFILFFTMLLPIFLNIDRSRYGLSIFSLKIAVGYWSFIYFFNVTVYISLNQVVYFHYMAFYPSVSDDGLNGQGDNSNDSFASSTEDLLETPPHRNSAALNLVSSNERKKLCYLCCYIILLVAQHYRIFPRLSNSSIPLFCQ